MLCWQLGEDYLHCILEVLQQRLNDSNFVVKGRRQEMPGAALFDEIQTFFQICESPLEVTACKLQASILVKQAARISDASYTQHFVLTMQ